MKFIFFGCLLIMSPTLLALPLATESYLKKPKLVVVLVIDQFRGELLNKMQKELKPAGTAAQPGGFAFLMKNGAWFPHAEYEVSQAMTCVGHAMILSGSYPTLNGISLNQWFDSKAGKRIGCIEDARDGISPRNLFATTVGDEMKTSRSKSKVISVAVKDRSAVLLGGHRADHAIWLNSAGSAWTTSTYYGTPPTWIDAENRRLSASPKKDLLSKNLAASIEGTQSTLRLAAQALTEEKLGRGPDTDLLAISLSNHDILGHALGPESPEMEKLVLAEDVELQRFFGVLQKQMKGWSEVLFVMTADHGIPGTPTKLLPPENGDGQFDALASIRNVNRHLDEAFKVRSKEPWITATFLLNFYLNEKFIQERGLSLAAVESEAKKALAKEPGVIEVFTRQEFLDGKISDNLPGRQFKNSYRPDRNGHLQIVLRPFMVAKSELTANHMTGWAYDRYVPLFLMGNSISPGVYAGGKIVDIAPTVSFLLGTVPPSMSEGRVLSETFRSVKPSK